jgi:hypothetical protein
MARPRFSPHKGQLDSKAVVAMAEFDSFVGYIALDCWGCHPGTTVICKAAVVMVEFAGLVAYIALNCWWYHP